MEETIKILLWITIAIAAVIVAAILWKTRSARSKKASKTLDEKKVEKKKFEIPEWLKKPFAKDETGKTQWWLGILIGLTIGGIVTAFIVLNEVPMVARMIGEWCLTYPYFSLAIAMGLLAFFLFRAGNPMPELKNIFGWIAVAFLAIFLM